MSETTLTDPDTLEGVELGIAVATEVMGWIVFYADSNYEVPEIGNAYIIVENRSGRRHSIHVVRNEDPSPEWLPWRDMAAAWEVAERVREMGWRPHMSGGCHGDDWHCQFMRGWVDTKDFVCADSYSQQMPTAICRTSLKAVRAKGGNDGE